MERDAIALIKLVLPTYFNSHAHVERDIIAVLFVGLIIISTHTLTWSVTFLLMEVFINA